MTDEQLQIQLDREDIILLLLDANERLLGKESMSGITRLEKLLFLLEKEAKFEGIIDFFHFEPHNFGPFSKDVYEAVEFLESCELIEIREKSYSSLYANTGEAKLLSEISETEISLELGKYPDKETFQVSERLFCLTENGRKVAAELRRLSRRPSDITELEGIVLRYGNRPLNHLIRYVYRRYPDMAVKSIHPEAQRIPH